MSSAIRRDRLWFQSNPSAIVRFRAADDGEFTPLLNTGATPPEFRPSICKPNAPLRWVAVVDLMRLAGTTDSDKQPHDPTLRVRLKVPALRSLRRQQQVEEELLDAIASELLGLISTDDQNVGVA